MKILDMKPGDKAYTQLSQCVLVVLSRREDGWCAYIDAVRGDYHNREWQAVASNGEKLKEQVAIAIVENYFFPGFNTTDCPYAR